jgi:hypothetical protein
LQKKSRKRRVKMAVRTPGGTPKRNSFALRGGSHPAGSEGPRNPRTGGISLYHYDRWGVKILIAKGLCAYMHKTANRWIFDERSTRLIDIGSRDNYLRLSRVLKTAERLLQDHVSKL